ncbi:MAG: Ig-like domain-containing protein [Planctomycetes bacterium]|nr:Ig-like domain-containing protein [Planctomycetota bacterium]
MVRSRRALLAAALLPLLCTSCEQGRRAAPRPIEFGIRPVAPSVPQGADIALRAVATWADGEQQEVGARAEWRSSLPAVATVDAAGVVTGRSVGITTVSARDPVTRLEHAVPLVVTPAVVASLAITPPNPQLANGTTLALTVTGTWTDGTTADLTGLVVWSSSAPAVATVDGTGHVTGVTPGTTTITALHLATGVAAAVALQVTSAVLVSLAVTPALPSIALGTTQQFTATGTFSDSTTQDLTAQVTWTSLTPATATVSNASGTEGLASSAALGTNTVRATDAGSGIHGETVLTVTAAVLVSIAVTPATPSIALGTTQQFAATGTYSDSTTQDLTTQVTWTSLTPATATVSNAGGTEGLATSAAIGTTTVRATDAGSGIHGETVLTVTAAVLVSIAVTPALSSIALGTAQQFAATGTYSDSTTQDLTTQVTWTSLTPATATVSNAGGSEGLATSAAIGTTTVRATDAGSGIHGETVLTVTAAVLVSIAVTPALPSIALGTTQQFTATGTYSDSTTQDLTAQVTWTSLTPATATVSNAGGSEGLATSAAAGTTTIRATDAGSGIYGETVLTVFKEVEVVAAAGGSSGTGVSSLALSVPAGTVADDLLLAAVAVRPSSATVTPPSGWTLVRRIDNSTGATNSLLVYRRAATAGEPASHTFSFSTSTGGAGGIAAFRWVDTAAPIDAENGQSNASGLLHAAPSVTSTDADAMLVTVHAFSSSATWTEPTGMTEAFDVRSEASGATGISLCLCYLPWPTAGATGTRTATASNDADTGNAATIVLRRR